MPGLDRGKRRATGGDIAEARRPRPGLRGATSCDRRPHRGFEHRV